MDNIKKLILICCILVLFSMSMIYENTQLRSELNEQDRTIIDLSYELHSQVPEKTCSQLGFCIGDLVELNDQGLEYLSHTNETYGTIKQIVKQSDDFDLIVFYQGNQEWKRYSEYWLRHKTTLRNNNETLEKVMCSVMFDDYCQTSFDPKTNSMWISNIPYE